MAILIATAKAAVLYCAGWVASDAALRLGAPLEAVRLVDMTAAGAVLSGTLGVRCLHAALAGARDKAAK